jgi:hypothetical protein
LASLCELATGKSTESDFTEDKSRMVSGMEAALSFIPGGKLEGALLKGGEKLLEKTVLKTGRRLWNLTTEKSLIIKMHGIHGKFYKSASDGLWWSVDNLGHGGSKFKVFKENSKGLEWFKDADEFGDFIEGKHKGPLGMFIPWKELNS